MLSHYVEPSWRGNGDTQTKGKIILENGAVRV
jgi:hypothetical protein